jgi:hypothetical protein
MNVNLTVNRKEFVEALSAVTLKGKYRNANKSKITNISNDVAVMLDTVNRRLTLANASDTLAATVYVNVTNVKIGDGFNLSMFFFEVEKIQKYLRTFKQEEIIMIITQSNVIIKSTRQRAQIPLLVEHSGITAITKLIAMKVSHGSDEFPMFGNTTFETKIVLDGDELSKAVKNCSIVGNATYSLDYSMGQLNLSSVNFHQTEDYMVRIPIISGEGEASTLEFSAPLDKFCSGAMFLYLKDNCPILLCGTDRRLLVAPYIRG